MIALTVRGSQSLSELTNNQISTMWERRLAPLKDVATTIEVEREVEGFNNYRLTPVDIRNAILASKCYPVEWDEDPAKLDHAYVDEYIDASDKSGYIHIHYTPEQSLVLQTYTKPYDSYSYHPMILVSDDINGFNYPTREYTVEFQIRRMYISGGWADYQAIYFLFAMDRFTRDKNMNWVDNRQCYGYAIRFLDNHIALVRMGGSHNVLSNWTVIKEWLSDYQSYPYTAKITIHKTPGYINVKDNSAYDGADRDFTLTAYDDPNIPNALGTYCGFAAGGAFANSWVIDFKDFIFSIPTKLKVKTIEKVNPATLSVDREANRALAPAIRYICDNSKFTADMYNSANLLKYDRLWRNNGDKFDFRFDTSTTVLEAIQQIAQVGYAEPITIGNQINIVRKWKDAPIAQMFTPANMTGDPKITYSFRTPDDTDEIDCKFTSASTWKSEEIYIQIDDDNKGIMRTQRNSANDEQCELLAVTDAQRAYKLGLRRLRDVLFSRTQIEFQTELDALNCQYGDLIAVALPQDLSVYSGRITSYDSHTGLITLSEKVRADELGAGVLYVRRPNGTAQTLTVLYNDDGTVVTTVPLDFEPDFSTPDTMPLYAFGRVVRFWVTSIKTSGNGTKCTVTGTVYDERVFVDDQSGPGPEPEPGPGPEPEPGPGPEPEPEPEPETTITINIDVENQTLTSSDPENVTVPTDNFDLVTFDGKSCIRANSSSYATFVFGENIESFTCKMFLQSTNGFTLYVEVDSANNTKYSLVYSPEGVWWNPDRAVLDSNNVLVGVWATVTYSKSNKTLTFDTGNTQLTRSLDNYLVDLSIGSYNNSYNIYLSDMSFELAE